MTNYLVIGYKPDSDDYCRGCHMASYPSDYFESIYNTLDEAVDRMSECRAQRLSTNEKGWDFTVYRVYDGKIQEWDDWGDWWVLVRDRTDELVRERREREAAESKAKYDAQKKAERDHRKAQYLELKSEFGEE